MILIARITDINSILTHQMAGLKKIRQNFPGTGCLILNILSGVIVMDPCELNVLITAITNNLFCTLSEKEFLCVSVFLNELSKSMFTTSLFADVCCPKDNCRNDNDAESELQ